MLTYRRNPGLKPPVYIYISVRIVYRYQLALLCHTQSKRTKSSASRSHCPTFARRARETTTTNTSTAPSHIDIARETNNIRTAVRGSVCLCVYWRRAQLYITEHRHGGGAAQHHARLDNPFANRYNRTARVYHQLTRASRVILHQPQSTT